jgi:hypothetical protein
MAEGRNNTSKSAPNIRSGMNKIYGVSHGSVLGPLRFVLYISNLTLWIITRSKSVSFADDTNVLITAII